MTKREEDESTGTQAIQTQPRVTAAKPTLIIIAGDLVIGKMFNIDRDETLVGRATEADIWLDSEGVSRKHAKLLRRGQEVELVDLGSKNGTYCNGQRIQNHTLQEGDRIQFGSNLLLKFSYQDALEEALQRNLYDSATRDGLTGIFNQRFFLETLNKEFAFAQRHDQPLSLLLLDLDHFKKVNDTYGHPAGDFVLTRFSNTVEKTLRSEDVFARYGGEEFAVLLREIPEESATAVAQRINHLVSEADWQFNKQILKVTVSIGVATLRRKNFSKPSALFKAADDNLYKAKSQGRNKVVAGSPGASPDLT